jgi:hypothetical protein
LEGVELGPVWDLVNLIIKLTAEEEACSTEIGIILIII